MVFKCVINDDLYSAFYDLNIWRFKDTWSVLNSVNKDLPKNIFYGGIINAESDMRKVFKQLLSNLPCFFGNIVYRLISKTKFLGNTIGHNLDMVSDILRKKYVEEYKADNNNQLLPANTNNPFIDDTIKRLRNGCSDKYKLKAKDHDFLIPSAYQVTLGNGKKTFLGNKVNRLSNHLSGGDRHEKGGKKNIKLLRSMIKEML